MGDASKIFVDFLNTGYGKKATRLLKDGATFKVFIDKEPFTLAKRGGEMEMSPGVPNGYGILLEMSASALEYLQDAKTEDDAHDRLDELIYSPTPERYARMKIGTEPREKGGISFYFQGFYLWARRMGFAS